MTAREIEELEAKLSQGLQGEELSPEERDHAELFGLLERKAKRQAFKENLRAIDKKLHASTENTKVPLRYKLKSFNRRYLVPSAVAATISLMVVFLTLFTVEHMNSLERKQISYYKSMRREVNRLKAQTRRIKDAYEKMQTNEDVQPRYYGATGFLVSQDGYFVTDYHVVNGAKTVFAEQDTSVWRLEVIKTYPKYDLALLKVSDSCRFLNALAFDIDTSGKAKLGEEIYSVGYPKEDLVYGQGNVASLSGFENDSLSYQISIPVNPGNSGAPVLSSRGQLLGIVTGKHTEADGTAYAIKSRYLHEIFREIEADTTLGKTPKFSFRNRLHKLNRAQQVEALAPSVFLIKVSN